MTTKDTRSSFENTLLCCMVVVLFSSYLAQDQNFTSGIRVIDSQLTTINNVPYLMQLKTTAAILFCGGTLVNPTHVVSAAHCFRTTDPSNVVVIGGATTLADIGIRRRVVATFVHPKFNTNIVASTHDIVVLRLNEPMIGANINPAPLCLQHLNPGSVLQVSGWGRTNKNDESASFQVHTVEVPTISFDECIERYGAARLSESMMCAGAEDGQDACYGDSGGPAVFHGQFCGIVSWGSGCGWGYYPGVYTDIMSVREWINQVTKQKV